MEEQTALIEILFEKTERYAKAGIELYKLKAIDKSADVISNLASHLVLVIFFTMFFVILNVGVALWIGEQLTRSYYGFFIVSGFYALAGIVLYGFRNKWIKAPMRNSVITQALN
jgi:hypothetical protein